MHPILFQLPLPAEFRLWWGLVAAAAIALVYAVLSLRNKQRNNAIGAVIAAVAFGAAAFVFRAKAWPLPEKLPIYSYGVMLGVSLVIGWYLTLSLAEKDGLPKETMANCYVITAIAAIVGSRLLYIVTNMGEFKEFSDIFALRKGGLVAYGGFIGGFLGSWAYLSAKKIRLMPWADAAVPSLASGLLVTRIGCYLFGCDFGKALPESAPEFLKKLGTFPHWAGGTLDSGDGAPAWKQQFDVATQAHDEKTLDILNSTNHSLPVHPTQIYESLVGFGLLVLLMWSRRNVKFRGQIFFVFVFAYGLLRFLLEIVRDDPERGSFGPALGQHTFIALCLVLFAIGFVFGPSLGIRNERARLVARIAAFLPAIVMFLVLKPASYAQTKTVQLSTSQWIALLSALAVSYFYARFWQEAGRSPQRAMALGEGAVDKPVNAAAGDQAEAEQEDDDEGEGSEPRKPMTSDTDVTQIETPAAKKTKKKKAKKPAEEKAEGESGGKEEGAEPKAT